MAILKDRNEPIYTISVAAKLVRPLNRTVAAPEGEQTKPIHAQTLRMYDRLQLVRPQKVGKNRFYSDRDIERLQQIQHFTQDMGINLAGVAYIFALLEQLNIGDVAEGMDSLLRDTEQRLPGWVKESL